MDAASLGQSFLDGASIPGVMYKHNDAVRVVSGAYIGAAGSLVTILSLDPEPRFVIESAAGPDIQVFQSEIALADA